MLSWFKKRHRPGRRELIERKHRLEGEINMLAAELRRLRSSGQDTSDIERRLESARSRHYQTRLDIDRAEPGS